MEIGVLDTIHSMLCGKPAHKEHKYFVKKFEYLGLLIAANKFCSYITAKVLAVDGPNGLPVEI